VQDLVVARESQIPRYHLLYYERTTFVKLPATRRLLLQPYQGPGPSSQFECTGEYRAIARHTAVMRVCGGANLNCTFQVWAIFLHPCAAYRQLKFCVQSLLDGLCKREKFQVRFRPDKPDHSLVRSISAKQTERFL
jgi:hypothetical protein